MRIAFSTFGCKINQVETDEMVRSAAAGGNTVVPFDDAADVYVINTCSVTGKTDYQCRQAIRAAVKRGGGAQVIVTGCYAETRPQEIQKIAGVSRIVSNRDKDRLLESVVQDVQRSPNGQLFVTPRGRKRTRTFLKIQDGCENYCSYCIIPFARGRSRSIAFDEVMRQFDVAVSEGTPEVVLSGIHIGKYGIDLQPARSLQELLAALLERRKGARIRLSSIEPREVTPLIAEMTGKGLCRHLHIPLQSGDDGILKLMNRNYDSKFYRCLTQSLAAMVPGVALGADVIVGFPGEGKREFQNTLDLIRDSPVTHLHVFSYSKRPGTAAASMDGQVADEEKKERSRQLRELAQRKNLEFRRTFLGANLKVVIEDDSSGEKGRVFNGMSDNYIRIAVSGIGNGNIRKEIDVKVNDVSREITAGSALTD